MNKQKEKEKEGEGEGEEEKDVLKLYGELCDWLVKMDNETELLKLSFK